MIDFNNPDIESYKKQLLKICKQLKHWAFLTREEQLEFMITKNRGRLDQLMTTSRVRALEADILKGTDDV